MNLGGAADAASLGPHFENHSSMNISEKSESFFFWQ
jgi:hypothetical protein